MNFTRISLFPIKGIKLTPPYPMEIPPEHDRPGLYLRLFSGWQWSYWSGAAWCVGSMCRDTALANYGRQRFSIHQLEKVGAFGTYVQWRGFILPA